MGQVGTVIPAGFFGSDEQVIGETGEVPGSQMTLNEAASKKETLPMWRLAQMDRVRFFFTMSPVERADWSERQLGPFSKQVSESALKYKVPSRLLAAVILNELTDINELDIAQDFVQDTGSLGIAQIQVWVADGENLYPGITPDEEARAFDLMPTYMHTNPLLKFSLSKRTIHRLAIAARLRTPQHAIDGAGRYVRILLGRASLRPKEKWQSKFTFAPPSTAPSTPQDWYAHIGGSSAAEKEANLAELITGIYNSPQLITTDDPAKWPNGINNGKSGGMVAQLLAAADLFGPIP